MRSAITAVKTGMVRKITRNMPEDDFKKAVREVIDWLNDGALVYDGMFCKIAAEIDRITDCGDYMKARMAEQSILEEAARRYVLPKDHGMKIVEKEDK